MESYRGMASSHRPKESERSHSRTSFPYVHDKLCAKLRPKRRLRVQIDLQDAYFYVLIHPSSRKYLGFAFENKVYQFRVLPFGLNTAPQVFTRLGHTVSGYLHRQGISVIPYLDDWLIHHPDPEVLLRHQAQLMNTLDLVGFVLNRKKSELDLTQDIQFLGIRLRLDLGEASLPESKAWEIVARARHLSSLRVLSYTRVPAHGVTQLGLRSHPSGSTVPETPATSFPFVRSDRPVYATASIRPSDSCQPTALAGPTFSYLRNSSPHVSGGVHNFYGRLHAGVGRSHGGFPDFGYLDPYRLQASHQLFGAQGGISCPTALGSNAPGPPGYGRYGQFDSSFIYQQTRGDPFPHLVAVDSRASPLVRGSEHNSPNKKYTRGDRIKTLIALSEPYQRCSRIADHLSRQNQPIPEIVERIFRVWGTPEVNMFATLSNSHLPRFMSPILEPRALAVDALSQDWQGRSMYMFPPFPLLSKVMQKLRSTQVAEVILVAPGGRLRRGFHTCYVSVWNTL